MEPVLEVRNLKKYFDTPGGRLHAVDDVSFSVKKKQTLGIVGESGCGKSTVGRLVLHLLDHTGGEIFYNGENISKISSKRRYELCSQMQMIFQDPMSSLDPRMTVFQTIAEPLVIFKYGSKDKIASRVYEIMDTVGIARRLRDSYPHELDGGRRQRVGIARALVLCPQVIICDEPVSALDVSIQAQILNLMQDLQAHMELTYLFITHDLSVVRYISHEIMVMYLGKVVEHCEAKELFRFPLHPYTKALLSAVPVPDVDGNKGRILLKGEITSPIDRAPGCRFAARCVHAKEKCFKENPRYREIQNGHRAACHYVEEINHMKEEEKP
ncbi:MAG: ATP-binding cassette domain-containing protein [Hungatella sp.]|nr:ATP-binding cassette domain-containing protein [Hungatella sp.]